MRDEAAAIFKVRPDQIKMRPGPKRSSRTTGHQAIDEWLESFISPEEKREWLRYGLGEHDLHIAKQWLQLGMRPRDLEMVLPDGHTALWRLKSGEGAGSVAQRVNEAKKIA